MPPAAKPVNMAPIMIHIEIPSVPVIMVVFSCLRGQACWPAIKVRDAGVPGKG